LKHTCIVIAICATSRYTFATSIQNIYNIPLKHLKHLKYTLATCVFSATSTCCSDEWRLVGTQSSMPVWRSTPPTQSMGATGRRGAVLAASDPRAGRLEKDAAGGCGALRRRTFMADGVQCPRQSSALEVSIAGVDESERHGRGARRAGAGQHATSGSKQRGPGSAASGRTREESIIVDVYVILVIIASCHTGKKRQSSIQITLQIYLIQKLTSWRNFASHS
jgi:hypothetical protein